jgi:hypothetical protein
MLFRALLLGMAVASASLTSASATVRISEDRGGQIGHYMHTFAQVRSTGERVVIDGNCLSACTLVLGLVPRDRICATSRARLGFHAAWMPDAYGRPVTSEVGTRALWDMYPQHVRNWINRKGGLKRKMIFLQGRELASMVPTCGSTPNEIAQTRLLRGSAPQVPYEERASATRSRY